MALKLAAAAATVVFLLVGLWVFGSPLSAAVADALDQSRYWSSIIFCVLWFVVAAIVLGKIRKERPELNWPLRGAFLATAILAAGIGAWTTLRDNVVDEDLPTGSALYSGEFTGIDHKGDGIATILELDGGDVRLALSQFEVSNAPDLRVYLTVDEIEDDAGEFIEIDRLKGNKGDQSYNLPDDVDLEKYDNVVIWCKAFDVGVAQAPLEQGS